MDQDPIFLTVDEWELYEATISIARRDGDIGNRWSKDDLIAYFRKHVDSTRP